MSEAVASKDLLKDFGYYARWFSIWAVLFNFVQPVAGEGNFWGLKLVASLYAVGFGVSCAAVFSVLQNSMNSARRKWLSWIFAILIWVSAGAIVALSTGRL